MKIPLCQFKHLAFSTCIAFSCLNKKITNHNFDIFLEIINYYSSSRVFEHLAVSFGTKLMKQESLIEPWYQLPESFNDLKVFNLAFFKIAIKIR